MAPVLYLVLISWPIRRDVGAGGEAIILRIEPATGRVRRGYVKLFRMVGYPQTFTLSYRRRFPFPYELDALVYDLSITLGRGQLTR